MTRFVAPDFYPDPQPAGLTPRFASLVHRLKLMIALTLALVLVIVLGTFLPLGTWLLLCGSLAAPTIASALLVAGD